MKPGARLSALAALIGAASCATAQPSAERSYLADFAAAERSGATFPHAAEAVPGLDMAKAYELQHRIVATRERSGDRRAGFKGGLMSAKSLADRKVSEPLVGVLFASGDTPSGGAVSLCGYRRAAMEMKLGFVFREAVGAPLPDVAALKARVAQVQGVVELPDIAYRDDKTYGALDMTAANISSAKFVRGAAGDAGGLDVDALKASIHRDGAPLTSGFGRESFGDQWGSLLRLVNLAVDAGYTIRPGDVFLTGKIGDKRDIGPGVYEADYGPLGQVRFTVAAC